MCKDLILGPGCDSALGKASSLKSVCLVQRGWLVGCGIRQ